MFNLFQNLMSCGADFSPCRTWRYSLWRKFESFDESTQNRMLMFIGLNPSTADETEDDPTVRRCIRFAKDWGYNGLYMLNAYGYRATNPHDMKRIIKEHGSAAAVGEGNNAALTQKGVCSDMIIAAWGNHCELGREREICELIARPIYCLGKTKSGRPKHPIYLRADTKPELFYFPSAGEK